MAEQKEKTGVTEEDVEQVIKKLEEREEVQRIRFEKEKDKLKDLSRTFGSLKVKKPDQRVLPSPPSDKKPLVPSPPPSPPPPSPLPSTVPQPKSRHHKRTLWYFFFLFILLIYPLLNYRLLVLHFRYLYAQKFKKGSFSIEIPPEMTATQLLIPKIGLKTPVVKEGINQKTGVSYRHSISPQENEPPVITGPSSIYPWQTGQPVFGLLYYLTRDDAITLVDQGETYLYKVVAKEITSSPSLKTAGASEKIDLVLSTPWPPGFSLRYLNIYAQKTVVPSQSEPEVFLPTIGP